MSNCSAKHKDTQSQSYLIDVSAITSLLHHRSFFVGAIYAMIRYDVIRVIAIDTEHRDVVLHVTAANERRRVIVTPSGKGMMEKIVSN